MGKSEQAKSEIYHIPGSLCENNDKVAVQRGLHAIQEGELLAIDDRGALGHAMGFQSRHEMAFKGFRSG